MEQESNQDVQNIVAQIREQWDGVIKATVASSQGNAGALAQLNPFLDQMEQKEDWQSLIDALRRIVAGERDPETLLGDRDDTDTLIISDILRALGVDPRALPVLPGEESTDDDDGQMISMQDFLGLVAQACKPNAPEGLKEQLQNATQGMVVQADNPAELKQLGRVLLAILAGERSPDLLSLDPRLIAPVREILDEIQRG